MLKSVRGTGTSGYVQKNLVNANLMRRERESVGENDQNFTRAFPDYTPSAAIVEFLNKKNEIDKLLFDKLSAFTEYRESFSAESENGKDINRGKTSNSRFDIENEDDVKLDEEDLMENIKSMVVRDKIDDHFTAEPMDTATYGNAELILTNTNLRNIIQEEEISGEEEMQIIVDDGEFIDDARAKQSLEEILNESTFIVDEEKDESNENSKKLSSDDNNDENENECTSNDESDDYEDGLDDNETDSILKIDQSEPEDDENPFDSREKAKNSGSAKVVDDNEEKNPFESSSSNESESDSSEEDVLYL